MKTLRGNPMMQLILNSKEIGKISGYKQPGRQIEWLKRMGISFVTDAKGFPVTTEAQIDATLNNPTKSSSRFKLPE